MKSFFLWTDANAKKLVLLYIYMNSFYKTNQMQIALFRGL